MTSDLIEQLDGATIQHGPLSNRIYVMNPGDADAGQLADTLELLAGENGYTKLCVKIPESSASSFLDRRYIMEAAIPGFFHGEETALCLSRFLDPDRGIDAHQEEIKRIIELALHAGDTKTTALPEKVSIRQCRENDAAAMAHVYSCVFPTYPFPIDNPGYLRDTMRTHIVYFGAEHKGKLIALASSEMDRENAAVEMTDFATLPSWRGRNLAGLLLREMESAMRKRNMKTAYTIARAISPGMNITFARAGYGFCGTLINNTNISGGIESMNVWYKRID